MGAGSGGGVREKRCEKAALKGETLRKCSVFLFSAEKMYDLGRFGTIWNDFVRFGTIWYDGYGIVVYRRAREGSLISFFLFILLGRLPILVAAFPA